MFQHRWPSAMPRSSFHVALVASALNLGCHGPPGEDSGFTVIYWYLLIQYLSVSGDHIILIWFTDVWLPVASWIMNAGLPGVPATLVFGQFAVVSFQRDSILWVKSIVKSKKPNNPMYCKEPENEYTKRNGEMFHQVFALVVFFILGKGWIWIDYQMPIVIFMRIGYCHPQTNSKTKWKSELSLLQSEIVLSIFSGNVIEKASTPRIASPRVLVGPANPAQLRPRSSRSSRSARWSATGYGWEFRMRHLYMIEMCVFFRALNFDPHTFFILVYKRPHTDTHIYIYYIHVFTYIHIYIQITTTYIYAYIDIFMRKTTGPLG